MLLPFSLGANLIFSLHLPLILKTTFANLVYISLNFNRYSVGNYPTYTGNFECQREEFYRKCSGENFLNVLLKVLNLRIA